jgi:hypothetical protein
LLQLHRPGHTQVRCRGEIRAAALAGSRRAVINHLVGLCPAHRRTRCPRLLAALAALAGLAPFPVPRLAPGQVISTWWHREVAAIAAQPPRLRDLGAKLLHRLAKLRDHLIAGGARHAPGIRWRQIGHKPP